MQKDDMNARKCQALVLFLLGMHQSVHITEAKESRQAAFRKEKGSTFSRSRRSSTNELRKKDRIKIQEVQELTAVLSESPGVKSYKESLKLAAAAVPDKEKIPLSRSRKSDATVTKKRTTIKQMSKEELAVALQEAVEQKSYVSALKYLERLLKLVTDPVIIADLLFLMGSIYFDTGEFQKAIIVFDDFKTKFQAHPSVEEAYYKSTLASYYITLDADRDQTLTRKTIERADAYLAHADIFDTFAQEVAVLRSDCLHKLADHELQVCEFLHQRRGSARAAERRLVQIEQTLLPQLPEIQPRILAMQKELGIAPQVDELGIKTFDLNMRTLAEKPTIVASGDSSRTIK
jgi:outer membrane protein assembly factor BamD (BamD/ComL family)